MIKCISGIGLAILALAALVGAGFAEEPLPDKIVFNRDVRPIFSDTCFKCHGPDGNKRKAKLRFDVREDALAEHKHGTPIVPGNSAKSEAVRRIFSQDPEELMPPPDSNKTLTARQKAILKRWIDQGATYQSHWAYLAPTLPLVPKIQSAGVKIQNPIDNYILERLAAEKLKPSPEADRVTLLRRVTLDLTGLPPTPAEVDTFLADKAPNAYEKVVDRLLASPHFGERLAVYWLDVVRYADSVGYHSDVTQNVSPYRDYVINAFNRNKPFDQFTIEQLAGDLLPQATPSQKVASAYNRLLQTTEEGGAQAKEYEYMYACDRVRNTATAWMASTMGCCQCHDHKFDPFSQKDFHSFAAIFADVQEPAVGGRGPGTAILDEPQQAELKQKDAAIATLKQKLEAPSPELAAAQTEWEKTFSQQTAWKVLDPLELSTTNGTKLTRQPDGAILASGTIPATEKYTVTAKTEWKGLTAFRLEVLPDPSFPAQGPGTAPNGNFVLTEFKITATDKGDATSKIKLTTATADHSQNEFPIANVLDGKKETGWALLPEIGKPHTAIFAVKTPVGDEGGTTLSFTLEFQSQFGQHQIGKFRLAVTTNPNPTGGLSLPPNLQKVLATAATERSPAQNKELATYYRTLAPALEPLRQEIAAVEKSKADLVAKTPKCLISESGPPRTVRIHARGNWLDETGEICPPNTPHFLPPPNTPAPQNSNPPLRFTRLDFARWLVAKENPLTARVFVNRLWALFYGTGISKSLYDLGSQGELPTHPELLDWLAVEFSQNGWDVKRIIKLMVTAAAYRQTSVPTKELKERDPYNRLYARQSRFRLDAEFIRDNELAISGLLVDKIGGPSVFPYQPAGYWANLNFPTREWKNSKGDDLYRRGLYTHWQRTFLHPSLYAFDACTREEATAERVRSNLPQQALVLLNDPTYVEASRVFAEHILKEGGATTEKRLAWAFRRALARAIQPDEAKILTDLEQKQTVEFTQDPAAAKKLVSIGDSEVPKDLNPVELAAWTNVARAILNLHETITRD